MATSQDVCELRSVSEAICLEIMRGRMEGTQPDRVLLRSCPACRPSLGIRLATLSTGW